MYNFKYNVYDRSNVAIMQNISTIYGERNLLLTDLINFLKLLIEMSTSI